MNETLHHHRLGDGAHYSAFGGDTFGRQAEAFARFFRTPRFLIGQTVIVAVWIAVNVIAVSFRWDPHPSSC